MVCHANCMNGCSRGIGEFVCLTQVLSAEEVEVTL